MKCCYVRSEQLRKWTDEAVGLDGVACLSLDPRVKRGRNRRDTMDP
ncbi:hypothetical protein BH23ACT2_BH23ACT2_07470 [soil metagenome]